MHNNYQWNMKQQFVTKKERKKDGDICTFTTWTQHDKAFSASTFCVSLKTDSETAAASSDGLNAKNSIPEMAFVSILIRQINPPN